MNIYGKCRRKLTIWLGSDDGHRDGMKGYGHDVRAEDGMLVIRRPAESQDGEDLEVRILPDLFPAIQAAMAVPRARPEG